ncbi:WbqC family protein [Eubacteriaceae bacterium ES3]|nr:WbqC family protein [Eubacteriaceae bacterium ES3]
MDISIMQPYLFPYIGYFQMIKASDYFIISDSVQYIQHGWINRNQILVDGKGRLITLPVVKDRYRLNINARYYVDDPARKFERKMLNTIYYAYRKAQYFEQVYQLVETILDFNNKNVADFTDNSLKQICNYLGIISCTERESEMKLSAELNAQEKIIYICKIKNADRYINAIGGKNLYSATPFQKNNLELKFIKTRDSLKYKQFGNVFVPNLSIIDVMMFNSRKQLDDLLLEYDLVD